MSNFMSVFEDLDRIYEEDLQQEVKTELTEEVEEVIETEEETEESVEEVEDTAVDVPVEEEIDNLQSVLECAKCGAITLKVKDGVIYDEASDLVNKEEACQYCEATEGFKVLGDLVPIEEEAVEEISEEAPTEETEEATNVDNEELEITEE